MQKGGDATPVTYAQAPVVTTPTAIVASAEPVSAAISTPTIISGDTINSEMVGTFYMSPSPDSPAFVKVGDKVSKGQTLCILEAMKIMNEIDAEFDCKIVEILVQDGSPVEYDMPLFVVEKL
jgi:acetyl-CoA carboxylase biotin carboxyl carrier protein